MRQQILLSVSKMRESVAQAQQDLDLAHVRLLVLREMGRVHPRAGKMKTSEYHFRTTRVA